MSFKLSEKFVQIADRVDNWEESVRLASAPLLEEGYIGLSYIGEMIKTAIDLNFYIVIMPLVAMPHARNDGSVLKNGYSVLKLNEPVMFDDEMVSLIIPLACVDNDSHMKMLMSIASVLGDESVLNELLASNDVKKIVELFKGE